MSNELSIIQISQNQLTEIINSAIDKAIAKHSPKTKQERQLLTPTEFRTKLDISRATEHNWKKQGIINPLRIGGKIYYSHSEVERILKEKGSKRAV